jgi:pimeloyl-ACP methyl ester carboxylesterase
MTLIVLIHGFFRTGKDMAFLKKKLQKHNRNVVAVTLPTTFKTLEECVDSLDRQTALHRKKCSEMICIGHSMGGRIAAHFITRKAPHHISKCLCIATPLRGNRIARFFSSIPGIVQIMPPLDILKEPLSFPLQSFTNISIGLVAGTKNNTILGKLFLQSGDGRVEVSSALAWADHCADTICLPCNHFKIHHCAETSDQIEHFIQHSEFYHPPA